MDFWLLDLNSDEHEGKPEIWLWGIKSDGRRILLKDSYQPYFYILPKPSQDPASLEQRLREEKTIASMAELSLAQKRLLSEERTLIRVNMSTSESLEKEAAKTVKSLGAEAYFEADLRPATKYQNEFEIRPCQWYSVEAEPTVAKKSTRLETTLRAKTHPVSIEQQKFPELNAIAFTLLAASQVGSPNAARDPIRLLAWKASTGKNGILQTTGESDAPLLKQFSEVVSAQDPDLIFSFGGNSSHWPYILRRSERTSVDLTIGRDSGPPRQSLYGHFSVTGRANVDLLDFAEDIYDVKEKSLGAVAHYLGVKDSRERVIDETEFFDYWSDELRRGLLVKTMGEEADTILRLGLDALDYVVQLSYLSGLPPDQALAAAVGFRVDNHMMMEAHKLGQLIPKRNEIPAIPYRGAIVLEPEPGLHDKVAVVDFSSMYPSLMVKYNISPDSITSNTNAEQVNIIPEIGTRFRKNPAGLYAIVLSELIRNRKKVKEEISKTEKGSSRHRFLKARERAAKIITNATYGYAGWAGSRWYSKQVAESAAAMGRYTINKAIEIAKRTGLKVLYGDTDSLFVNYDKALVQRFIASIDHELGLEINLSQTYERILFTEARKKYAGLRENGELDVVGMEAVRGDWSMIAKEVQNKILQFVLEDNNPSRALAYVRELAHELSSEKRPLSSFTIWKTLTKRPEQYDVHAPHVEAAKKLVKEGWPVGSGDRVGFVIVKRPGKVYQKAEPYFKASTKDIDTEYYLQNQILPVAARALSVFGITEEIILEGKNA